MKEFYIYINGNIQQYSLEQLKGIGIKPDDFICRVGSEEWTRAGNFEELNDFFYHNTATESSQKPILETFDNTIIIETPTTKTTQTDYQENTTQPKPSKVLIIIGILSIFLLIGSVWFSLKDKSPITPPIPDSTAIPPVMKEPIAEDCSMFGQLISDGKNLMGESDLQKKEEALLYFEKAKDLINVGCNTTENTNIINQQANDYKKQADDLENSYEQLSADIKNSSAGTTILNRVKYFRKASQILTITQK